MEEKRIQSYLMQQVRLMVEAGSQTLDTLRAYFGGPEPRDKEILGLLALTIMRPEFPLRHRFATPLEAVSRLSFEARAELCQEFLHLLGIDPQLEASVTAETCGGLAMQAA